MSLEIRSWTNPQPNTRRYSTTLLAREASYFTAAPESATIDAEHAPTQAPALIKSPSTVADTLVAYRDLGLNVVRLGGFAATPHERELRSETLRLIRHAAAALDTTDASA